jgi:hypothetical protein
MLAMRCHAPRSLPQEISVDEANPLHVTAVFDLHQDLHCPSP